MACPVNSDERRILAEEVEDVEVEFDLHHLFIGGVFEDELETFV